MTYAPPPLNAPGGPRQQPAHENAYTRAAALRAPSEQAFQNLLQTAQFQAKIYNPDIEPEHEADYWCTCGACQVRRVKTQRVTILNAWAKAVMYPGEKSYNDTWAQQGSLIMSRLSNDPYTKIVSPYGPRWSRQGGAYYNYVPLPLPAYHKQNLLDSIALNKQLNEKSQQMVDDLEPKECIWKSEAPPAQPLETTDGDTKSNQANGDSKSASYVNGDTKLQPVSQGKLNADMAQVKIDSRLQNFPQPSTSQASSSKDMGGGRFSSLFRRKSKVVDPNAPLQFTSFSQLARPAANKASTGDKLAADILFEEAGRWPDAITRNIVAVYQEKMGMTRHIADLRLHKPLQYLHLLRAGYFEPIPTAFADAPSNPLKFSIEAAAGWRGITPAWRGYEDTAEERLYWVLNHRDPINTARMKPDFVSEMQMARDRIAMAVEAPPEYYDPKDVCHVQHKSEGYSKQVMPRPFQAYDRPELPSDDTMILVDVSGSMNFEPMRPVYTDYLITGFAHANQPKNKDIAKAIIRRFTDAMQHHDHSTAGYDLVTFSSHAQYIGSVNHSTFEDVWRKLRIGGQTRVMTGWQMVKRLHFEKHHESATHHPVFGWQAGPQTPMLRLLVLLDGEAQDTDEWELDLLACSWAHITVFLIGIDGDPHHARHANELSRISDANPHISFVDAQGNTPERYVTHELLKRHLGIDLSIDQFREMEDLPEYKAI